MLNLNIVLGYGLQFNLNRLRTMHSNKDDENIRNNNGYESYIYIADSISDNKDNVLVEESDIDYFIELIGSFLLSQLISGKTYEKEGFIARMVTKEKVHYLQIAIADGDTIYLEKLDCHVLLAKLRRIWQKCIDINVKPNNIVDIVWQADIKRSQK